jgi:hydroxymethylglutaryl-CoA lyase
MGLFESLPPEVAIHEVSPRDGLQNESATVPTNRKLRLISALADAGLRRIEVTSFVSPRWVPQLADADELTRCLPRRDGVTYSALVPNGRGLQRAIAGGMTDLAVFVSASETHNRKNVNKSVAETMHAFKKVLGPAQEAGLRVRGYISTVWGCPYEGEIETSAALRIAHELLSQGCDEISLGDTIGVGTPLQTKRILQAFLQEIPAEKIALHLHDTRGTALANVVVGLEMGIRIFDASIGGLGGCPYAPGAAGNVATEDLVFMLDGMGVSTGVDLEKLWNAGKVAEAVVGRELPGKVHQAGVRSLSS